MSRYAWDKFSKTILVRYVLSYLCGTLYLDPSVSLTRIFAFPLGGLFSLSTHALTCLSLSWMRISHERRRKSILVCRASTINQECWMECSFQERVGGGTMLWGIYCHCHVGWPQSCPLHYKCCLSFSPFHKTFLRIFFRTYMLASFHSMNHWTCIFLPRDQSKYIPDYKSTWLYSLPNNSCQKQ